MSKHIISRNNELGNSYRYYRYRDVVYLYWVTYIKKNKKRVKVIMMCTLYIEILKDVFGTI